MAKTTEYDVAIQRGNDTRSARITTCVVIAGYSTVDDIPKMIEIKYGADWKILAITEASKEQPCDELRDSLRLSE